MDWLPLTLLCAFSLASADAVTKGWLKNYSATELTLIRFFIAGLLVSPLLLSEPFPALPSEFWAWIAVLVPLEILAMLLYMQAIRDHPLALTLPYLAFTPVFVVLTGYLILGERVSAQGLTGVLLVVCGAWFLNAEQTRPGDWRSWAAPFGAVFRNGGSRLMLGVAVLYSLTSVLGKGAIQYMPPKLFGPFYFALIGVLTLIVFSIAKPSILVGIWRRPVAVLATGLLTGVMLVTHFIALAQTEVAYMIAVKRTSLLFAILYGALFFGERRLALHFFAGSLMVAGVALIAWNP